MTRKLVGRNLPPVPRLSAEWLGATGFVVVALALLIGALAITLGSGAGVQSEIATRRPNSQAAPNAELALLSSKPTPTARVIASPVPKRSNPTLTDKPLPRLTDTPSPVPTTTVAEKPQGHNKPFVVRFGAADWQGGYFGGDAEWYGRAWTAVYRANSANSRASLLVQLPALPRAPATLTVSGVDDEWPGNNPISITVNGVEIFSGPSPFASWDGGGPHEGSVWTQVAFAVPTGLLHAGANEIALENLSQAANVRSSPYVLVSDAVLVIDR
ncbi:MAG: hypothetical protein ACJ789_21260 [Thermomicrobiales bacterium]